MNMNIETNASQLDTINWCNVGGAIRIYGSQINKPFTIKYILLTEKDYKRFAEYYPMIAQSLQGVTWQLLEVLQDHKRFGAFSTPNEIPIGATSGEMSIYGDCKNVIFKRLKPH